VDKWSVQIMLNEKWHLLENTTGVFIQHCGKVSTS
jgi:hypothetical protein